jgi:hypothetical protein
MTTFSESLPAASVVRCDLPRLVLTPGKRASGGPRCARAGRLLARDLQGVHGCERRAPDDQPLCVQAGCRGEPLAARCDRLEVVRSPEDQVDRVEPGVADAWRRVDRDQPALGAAVEDVAGRQVAVQQDARRAAAGKPSCQLAPARVERRRDQRGEPRVMFVELRRGVEQVADAVPDRRVGRVGNASPVEGAEQLGDTLRGGVGRGDDERRSRFDRFDQKRPELLVERDHRRSVQGVPGVERGRLERQAGAVGAGLQVTRTIPTRGACLAPLSRSQRPRERCREDRDDPGPEQR